MSQPRPAVKRRRTSSFTSIYIMIPTPASFGAPPCFQALQPVQSTVSSFWQADNVHGHLSSLRENIDLLKSVQNELEAILLIRGLRQNNDEGDDLSSGHLSEQTSPKTNDYMLNAVSCSFRSDMILQFSEMLKAKRISLNVQESLSLEAAKYLFSTLKNQLIPFGVITSQLSSWEEKSVAVRLAQKLQKSRRNKRWKKKKRRSTAELLRKDREAYDKADKDADEWRAREIAKDTARRKVESMKEIAKAKANEERKRLESELRKMHKGGKKWVKPGWTAHKLSEYEKQRAKTIVENQARMNALGLHQAVNSLRCSVEKITHASSSKNGKRKMSDQHDDDEYSLLEGEDHSSDDDDEPFNSPIQKVAPMPPKRQSARLQPPSQSTDRLIEGAQPQHLVPQHELVANPPITPCSSVASTTTKRAVRGPTRGQRTERLVERSGKLSVEVPNDCNVPVGPNASSLTSELGKEIRGAAPLQDASTWDDIDSSLRAAIIQRTLDKFDIKDYDTDKTVQTRIEKICQSRYRDWKCVLHRKYEKLLEKGVDPKTKPPRGVKPEDWNYMIDHVWTDEKWKTKSKKAKVARSHLPYNHTCGSRSFPATMSIMASTNGGQKPHIRDFYKESHWSRLKNDWVHPTCKEKYDEFVKLSDRCSQSDAAPMSQEEMSIEVLGSRPGYLRGYGVGPKPSSSRTIAQSRAHEEVKSLREVIESQNRQIEAQNKKIEEFEVFKAFTMNALQHVGFVQREDRSLSSDNEETSS